MSIFLDDAHVQSNEECTTAIPLLSQRLPEGCRLIVASRSSDLFPVGKLRLQGALIELDAHALAMSDAEASELFAAIGVDATTADVASLNRRAEGWIAGLLMAAQLLQQRSDTQAVVDEFDGSDRGVAEYLIDEVLEWLPTNDRAFLLRTSILPRLRGDLCDAVSGLANGAERLDRLERANAFVIPLDRQRQWYRYHHLFAELLADVLDRQHPDEVGSLHERAFEWCEAEGLVLDAIDHALTAGRRRAAATLLAQHWYDFANSGQIVTARRLLDRFTADEIMAYQPLALTAAWVKGVTGESDAPAILAAAEDGDFRSQPPDGSASMKSAVSLARSVFGWDGVDRSLADAEFAYALEPHESRWRPVAAWLIADRHIWRDDWAAAKPFLDEVVDGPTDQGPIRALALAMLALWHLERGSIGTASELSEQASRLIEDAALGDIVTAGSVHAIRARVAHAAGAGAQAKASLAAARAPVGRIDRALSLGGIHAQILLAEAAYAIGDIETTQENVAKARAVASTIDDTGAFTDHLDRLSRAIAESSGTFTDRELEVIGMFETELTNAEICEALFISRNTLKSHVRRIYKKLGVSSPAAAIDEANRLGLTPTRPPT